MDTNNNMSLLDIAKQTNRRKNAKVEMTPEMLELAIAWMRGDVTNTQVAVALRGPVLGGTSGNELYPLARALREAYRQGLIYETNRDEDNYYRNLPDAGKEAA
jgi:hypothetical protein